MSSNTQTLSDFPETVSSPLVTQEIFSFMENSFKERENDTNVNRASAASGCVRKRWYKAHGYKGEPMQGRAYAVFLNGDLIEHAYKYLIAQACVGPDKFYSEVDFGQVVGELTLQGRQFTQYAQDTVNIDINGLKVTGHADGWGRRNSDGQWELIEIKSSASYGFDRFKSGEIPDYIKQAHALLMSDKAQKLGAKSVRFLYMCKDTSHMFDRVFEFDVKTAELVRGEFIAAQAEDAPERPFGPIQETFRKNPTGRTVLPWQCGYCEFRAECQPNFKMEISKTGKPVFVEEKK